MKRIVERRGAGSCAAFVRFAALDATTGTRGDAAAHRGGPIAKCGAAADARPS
jgi:hypothetical protein